MDCDAVGADKEHESFNAASIIQSFVMDIELVNLLIVCCYIGTRCAS